LFAKAVNGRKEKYAMGFSEKDIEAFQKNELKPEDTFRFECKMCGNCCRNRGEPILITGADIYGIAKGLGTTTMDVVAKKTVGCIGTNSHIPTLVLKERLDGSCSLLRNGRCMVHQNKPTVCALSPLGRYHDSRDGRFHYFMNTESCQLGEKNGKVWTLQEWLDEFNICETEKLTGAWVRLIGGVVMVTYKMKKEEIDGPILDALLNALYLGYDTNIPYIEQVEAHMEHLKVFFKKMLHKDISFDIT